MNIGIMTFHRAINYGAILQAYALNCVLNKLGADVKIIDYLSPSISSRHKLMRPSLNPIDLYRYLRYSKTVNAKFEHFQLFLDKMNLSSKASSFDELNKLSESMDAVICGSDQVWNTEITNQDFHYFLDFVPHSVKKIAYAASFGQTQIPKSIDKTIGGYLRRFDSISVREDSGAELVDKLIGKRPDVVLDPTILLSKEEWRKLRSHEELPERYILVYSVGEIEKLFPTATEISNKTGLPLVVFSHREYSSLSNTFYIKTAGPTGFIDAFDRADYVITNSFHGTAFSVIFRKKFLVQTRTVDTSKGLGINSRIITLLEKTGLNRQVYKQGDSLSLLDATDYSDAEERISFHKKTSINFLKKSLFY